MTVALKIPRCPKCHSLTFTFVRCPFCGIVIQQDDKEEGDEQRIEPR